MNLEDRIIYFGKKAPKGSISLNNLEKGKKYIIYDLYDGSFIKEIPFIDICKEDNWPRFGCSTGSMRINPNVSLFYDINIKI
jgi:hypothetical protein